jgi:thiol-disulfide isomerase/thioredoxin
VRRAAASLLATALLSGLLAGCSEDPSAPDVDAPKVDVDTPALREQKSRLGVEDCAEGEGTGPVEGGLPPVTLACFGGGPDVDVSTLRGPLVVNFWQGACVPCRQEMPALEEFHQRYGDEVPVLGIDYLDAQPGYAMDLVESTGVTYPLLADPDPQLGVEGEVRVVGLPHFVLLDADGRIAYQAPGGIESVDELVDMVEEHLGVAL